MSGGCYLSSFTVMVISLAIVIGLFIHGRPLVHVSSYSTRVGLSRRVVDWPRSSPTSAHA